MHRIRRGLLWAVSVAVIGWIALPLHADREADLAKFEKDFKEIKPEDLKGMIRLFKWCIRQKLFEQMTQVGDKIIAHDALTVRDYKLLASEYCRTVLPEPKDEKRTILLELSSGFAALGSAHYLVFYDGGETFAEGRAEWLEKGFKNFYYYMPEIGIFPRFPSVKLTALAFDDSKGYNHYGMQRGVPPYMTSGFYSMLDNRLALYNEKKGAGYQQALGEVKRVAANIKDMARTLKNIRGGDSTKVYFYRGSRQILTTKGKVKRELKKAYAKLKSRKAALKRLASRLNVEKTLHEGAHQLAYNVGVQDRGSPYPLWVSEGIATVFESSGDATGWGPRRVNRARCKRLKKQIKNGKARSVLQVVGFDRKYKDNEDAFNMYAESYGLFLYLLRFEPAKLRTYLRLLREREVDKIEIDFVPGKSKLSEIEKKFKAQYEKWKDKEVATFEKHFEIDLDDMTRKWHRFISELSAR